MLRHGLTSLWPTLFYLQIDVPQGGKLMAHPQITSLGGDGHPIPEFSL